MTHNKLHILAVAMAALLVVCACKSAKQTAKPTDPTPPPQKTASAEISNTDFKTLSVNFSTQVMDIGVSGQIRMQKDKVIWISITKLIEFGRLKLTPDSAYAVIKIKNQAFAGTYKQFQKQFGIALNFDIAQAVILGNDISGYSTANKEITEKNKTTDIKYAERTSPKNAMPLKHNLTIDKATGKILHQEIYTSNPPQSLSADYSAFETFGKTTLPQSATITVSSNSFGKTTATLRYSKIQLNTQLSFPISISKKSKPINL